MRHSVAQKHSWTTLQNKETFASSIEDEVHAGLSRAQKMLPSKYFYDKRGSELFDAITELPEYYPTRTEIRILRKHIHEIAELLGKDSFLLELGSGSSTKIRLLLEATRPKQYVPMDISREHLLASAELLVRDYPWLDVHAAYVDYAQPWSNLDFGPGRYNVFFPGSSIGNFEPAAAIKLLRQIYSQIREEGGLLIGVDLKKDVSILKAAYNDAQGITAEFNLNILTHINKRLDANFDLSKFKHRAHYNAMKGRIEMHLESRQAQSVTINGNHYRFRAGETIHTENSYKYSIDEFREMAQQAGFTQTKTWIDEEALFSVHFLRKGQ